LAGDRKTRDIFVKMREIDELIKTVEKEGLKSKKEG
jgi:hypothetical protein